MSAKPKTVEVECLRNGEFKGNESEVTEAGIEYGELCVVVKADQWEAVQKIVAKIEHLQQIIPKPPNAVTWEQGCRIIDAVQAMLHPKPETRAALHYSGCPTIQGKPVCTCGGRSG